MIFTYKGNLLVIYMFFEIFFSYFVELYPTLFNAYRITKIL